MNYMNEIKKILGLEYGQRFKIEGADLNLYLTKNGLLCDEKSEGIVLYSTLGRLLCGKEKIIVQAWKPKFDELYYGFQYNDGRACLNSMKWKDDYIDHLFYKIGNCYRTENDAAQDIEKWGRFYHSPKVVDVLGGKENE